MFDEAKIKAAITSIIEAIGDDPRRDGLVDTPARIAEMYSELFMGMDKDPRDELNVGFEAGHREMVIVRDIPFYSMCEHHLLPFYGTAHVGYIPDVQGRVFAVRRMIAWSSLPLAYLAAGPLADQVFEPLLVEGGALANSVGRIIGTGQGRGIGMLYLILGIISLLATAAGFLYPRLRRVEIELPDIIVDGDDGGPEMA